MVASINVLEFRWQYHHQRTNAIASRKHFKQLIKAASVYGSTKSV